ncbi:MAG: hypothetical protein AAFY71_24045 [Bacteroidota bacterium]
MKNKLIFIFLLFAFSLSWGQDAIVYTIDLNKAELDKVFVEVEIPTKLDWGVKPALFFPKTVPGTYAELDYGNYVKDIQAFDKDGQALKVKREKPNTFLVEGGTPAKMSYTYLSTWESKKSPHIFEPAGCAFVPGDFFFINGGMFGFPSQGINTPYELSFVLPTDIKGYCSLDEENDGITQTFLAKDYHAVIDHPIIFTAQKANYLSVANTKVGVAAHAEHDSASFIVSEVLEESMIAIEKFVGKTPVDKYNYLIYYDKNEMIEAILTKMEDTGKPPLGKILVLLMKEGVRGLSYGALEHGTSSMYYMVDNGKEDFADDMTEVAIHEFMHIYAPLTLHTEMIGDFDYVNPTMSQHLWLYEGVTEYFSELIQLQGGLVDLYTSLNRNFASKIRNGERFPDDMSFTEMSTNVFKNPWKREYGMVYTRGAVLAMLLDFEIMSLTQGEKCLKDIVFALSEKYGANKSIPEDKVFQEFVDMVHPDLMQFFERYIIGTEAWDLEGGLAKVGIQYLAEDTTRKPYNPHFDPSNLKFRSIGEDVLITKVKDESLTDLREGDLFLEATKLQSIMMNMETSQWRPEGSPCTMKIKRDGLIREINFKLPYKKRTSRRLMIPLDVVDMSPMQGRLFAMWTKGYR